MVRNYFWSLGGTQVKVGDRVMFSGLTGTVSRFADRKRGPGIVISWDTTAEDGSWINLPPGVPKYFWPDQLTLIQYE